MAPTRQTMARALALEAGEFFDKLAEGEKNLKAAELHAAADYASRVAEQFRKWANAIEAEAQAEREARRAQQWAHASRWNAPEAQGNASVGPWPA
jgi:hypothetical protein